MSIIDIKTKAEFDELVKKTPYVALQAHAVWCGPCKAISPFFSKFATSLNLPEKYAFARFDTDEVPDLAFELGVRSIPAFYFFEKGDKTTDLTAPKPPALQKTIEDLSTKAKATDSVSATTAATTATSVAGGGDNNSSNGSHL